MNQTLDKIRKKHIRRMIKRTVTGLAGAAAVFAVVLVWRGANPVLASRLPFIGHLFEQVEQEVSYKGDYSKDPIRLVTEESSLGADDAGGEKMDQAAASALAQEKENPYIRTSNGITVTVSEITYTRQALYLAVCIESHEPFPEDCIKTKNMKGYILDYDRLEIVSEAFVSEMEGVELYLDYLEGQFEDSNTFLGIGRIDLAHCTSYSSDEEIEEAGLKELKEQIWEEGISDEEAYARADEFNLKLKEVFPETGDPVELPEEFTVNLNISSIWSELLTGEMVTGTSPDGEEVEMLEPDRKAYDGEWQFSFDVKPDDSKLETVAVNDTNGAGEGIASVTRSPYEITVEPVIPSDRLGYDYFTVICDANGDLLDYQGSSTTTYQTYGRDTDTVYVYLCDYLEYMDELKGYYWSVDYQEKKKTKTFAQFLDERALYGTKVTFAK